jgi:hypothetical protein
MNGAILSVCAFGDQDAARVTINPIDLEKRKMAKN